MLLPPLLLSGLPKKRKSGKSGWSKFNEKRAAADAAARQAKGHEEQALAERGDAQADARPVKMSRAASLLGVSLTVLLVLGQSGTQKQTGRQADRQTFPSLTDTGRLAGRRVWNPR